MTDFFPPDPASERHQTGDAGSLIPPSWGQPPHDPAPAPQEDIPGPGSWSPEPTSPPPDTAPVPPGGRYPRPSRASLALVVSILGIFCCGVPAPIGLILGSIEIRAIDQGLSDPEQRGTARAATIIGAVATILFVGYLGILALSVFATRGSGG